jgi:D-glycero-D-manno-heptose 1,7-bisphosphate phosphatase
MNGEFPPFPTGEFPPVKHAAVFLDRDGTLNEEVGYIHDPQNLNLISGAGEAIRTLNQRGILAILVTNQSGPARGYYPESHIHTLHQRLNDLLLDEGAVLDDLYYCPHLPDGTDPRYAISCACRKPGTELVDRAVEKHGIDLARSYVVGDKATDVELGQAAGCKTILLTSGYGERVLAGEYQWKVEPDFVAPTVLEAVTWILADLGTRE